MTTQTPCCSDGAVPTVICAQPRRIFAPEGRKVAFTHFRYINPLPSNTGEVLRSYKKVIVAELNTGQFADYLQAKYPDVRIERINKVQGQPFLVEEVVEGVKRIMDEK